MLELPDMARLEATCTTLRCVSSAKLLDSYWHNALMRQLAVSSQKGFEMPTAARKELAAVRRAQVLAHVLAVLVRDPLEDAVSITASNKLIGLLQ